MSSGTQALCSRSLFNYYISVPTDWNLSLKSSDTTMQTFEIKLGLLSYHKQRRIIVAYETMRAAQSTLHNFIYFGLLSLNLWVHMKSLSV